jgi:hypothetical protein
MDGYIARIKNIVLKSVKSVNTEYTIDNLDEINYDFRLNGLHKKKEFDDKGDLVKVEYYQNYDENTSVYSNLKITETRTYTRDANSKLLIKRDNIIDWKEDDGVTNKKTKSTTKHYDSQSGYDNNKRAKRNIINKASMYLFFSIGEVNAKAFLVIIATEISIYIDGNNQPLLDLISNSTETYMTTEVKATLNTILDVQF